VTVLGEMEQSVDLVAQTRTVLPAEYRNERVSGCQRKRGTKTRQITGCLSAFVSTTETQRAIQAIIDWFGVFSPLFSHALVTASLPRVPPSQHDTVGWHNFLGTLVNDPAEMQSFQGGVDSAVLRESLIDRGVNFGIVELFRRSPESQSFSERFPEPLSFPRWGLAVPGNAGVLADRVPGVGGGWALPSDAPLEAAPQMGTVIERVWNPPVYWQLLSAQRSLPKAVRETLLELPRRRGLCGVRATRWATWQERFRAVQGGARPIVYHDPSTSPQDALALFYEIVDHQYGPVVDGRLFRPNACAQVPSMRWKDVPF